MKTWMKWVIGAVAAIGLIELGWWAHVIWTMPLAPHLEIDTGEMKVLVSLPSEYELYWNYVKLAAMITLAEGAAIIGLLIAIWQKK